MAETDIADESAESVDDTGDDDRMYYCLKCDHRHRVDSMIGAWHEPLRIPELKVANQSRGRTHPSREEAAALICQCLAAENSMSGVDARVPDIRNIWDERFDDQFPNTDPIEELRSAADDHHSVSFGRWEGRDHVILLDTNHWKIVGLAREYDTRGMSWGVRH